VRPATDQLAAMVALLSQSASKTAMSEEPGTAEASPPPSLQEAGSEVDQSLALVPTLSPLPPTQYLVAACVVEGREKKNKRASTLKSVVANFCDRVKCMNILYIKSESLAWG